ncbi:putative rRNA-processing protein EBP2-like protein [Auxenochlorella protothecoides]|uniref:Putative rRNA-processing protein EBP2-like protein n=1 Tax=Auxenochlorella protothecoides TaxID=3075 RepID=A0A087SMH6_AUXPR|nr:putative rRNA-processing protein EBP2-like protein [Auxenochlorella protothecoides]KFM26930.1 putative rRNA-processing protein EBP2-like protein [Auxenochlorella protothecoides]
MYRDGEETSSSSESDYSDTEVGPAEAAEATGREVIYNADVLHEKLEDFGWSEQERWEETLVITGEAPTTIANVEDDLERELAFYNQAAAATQAAIARMEAAGQAWARPPDYLAEMVKSDEHMAKIKEQMLHQSKLVTEMEQRKKDRESKRFAKQVQAEKKKERAQEKKASISDVSKLRKQRKQSGFEGELDVDAALDDMSQRRASAKNPGERFKPRDITKKRARKDSKFGFGGKKRLLKQNDAVSSADGVQAAAEQKHG